MANAVLSMENEVFAKFAFYAGLVLLKTVVMSSWTTVHRMTKKVALLIGLRQFMSKDNIVTV